MGPNFIVVTPPVLNDDLGFQPVAEPLHGQAFIPELAVETFIGTVLIPNEIWAKEIEIPVGN
jgi:hypothetical protein